MPDTRSSAPDRAGEAAGHVPGPRALVLVGRGRYQDQWHDDAAAAQQVGDLLTARGATHRVRGTSPVALDDVGHDDVDLVVVLAGRGRRDAEFDGDDAAWVAFHRRLVTLVESGVPLLAVHQAANTFGDSPAWSRLVGGRWIDGTSWHPAIGDARFVVRDADHPVTAGLDRVEAFDERYCDLAVDPASRVLVTARHDGREHPVVWVAPGPGRVLYDGLGHDVRSYASPSRRELLRREVDFLLAGPPRVSLPPSPPRP